MKKLYAILGSVGGVTLSAVVFFIALQSAYSYVRHGDPYDLPGGCGAKATTAIQSVYPGVAISSVQQWHCTRTFKDPQDPSGALCYGVYHVTLPAGTWWQRVQQDGFAAWAPIQGGVDRENETVTVSRTTKTEKLDAAQMAAHTPLMEDCLKDDSGGSLSWGQVVDFDVHRTESGGVEIQANYATSDPDPLDVADAVQQGKALWPLVEAE